MYFTSTVVINGDRMINVGSNTDPGTFLGNFQVIFEASFVWRNNLWFAYDNPNYATRPGTFFRRFQKKFDVFKKAYNGGTNIGEIYNQNPGISNVYQISGNGPGSHDMT